MKELLKEKELSKNTVETFVKGMLTKHAIPFHTWGKGEAKTVEHLIKEVEDGECTLIEDAEGRLLRKLETIVLWVWYTNQQTKERHLLKEAKQVFIDGRERIRNFPDSNSLAEKVKPGEDIDKGVIRALREELGVQEDIRMTNKGDKTYEKISMSYPGLSSQYIVHQYTVDISSKDFQPEGYKEEQPDKTTYFAWGKQEEA